MQADAADNLINLVVVLKLYFFGIVGYLNDAKYGVLDPEPLNQPGLNFQYLQLPALAPKMHVHGLGLDVIHDIVRDAGSVEVPAFEEQAEVGLEVVETVEHGHGYPKGVEGAEEVVGVVGGD